MSSKAALRWAALSAEQKQILNEKRRLYYARTREARLIERRRSYGKLKQDPEYMEKRREYTNGRRLEKGRSYEKGNPEVKRKYKNTAKGKAAISRYEVARRTGIKQATPLWANLQDIGDVYMEAAYMQMQVDHIVPLKSNLVCGLHVWDNLQLMDAVKNNQKNNRHWPDMPA